MQFYDRISQCLQSTTRKGRFSLICTTNRARSSNLARRLGTRYDLDNEQNDAATGSTGSKKPSSYNREAFSVSSMRCVMRRVINGGAASLIRDKTRCHGSQPRHHYNPLHTRVHEQSRVCMPLLIAQQKCRTAHKWPQHFSYFSLPSLMIRKWDSLCPL